MRTSMIHSLRQACLTAAAITGMALPAMADGPVVEDVQMEKTGMGWRVSVTLSHDDTGWEHFADSWRIEDAEGKVIAVRKLMHPHVDEQPFTRSLSSVVLPDGTREIFVRAHCSKGGWHDETTRVKIAR
ncbi:MAG: hypothetical protein VXZ18_14970 [Pseudomonadota bacterium]|nr:hypothetical protein [Pseudomonadota bacterium]MEC8582050.1 hypothetical protein [Pseudomonadota bacterium]